MTLEAELPRTCASCAHLIGRRGAPEFHEGWLCGAPQNITSYKLNLVSGVSEAQYHWRQCLEARKDEWQALPPNKRALLSCGEAGQWWQLYIQPEYSPRTLGKVSADDLFKELENT